jgi:CHAT domain-containing protein/tetratricopeptide (TPR) repeat protein
MAVTAEGRNMRVPDKALIRRFAEQVHFSPESWPHVMEKIRDTRFLLKLIFRGEFLFVARPDTPGTDPEPMGFLLSALYYEAARECEPLARDRKELERWQARVKTLMALENRSAFILGQNDSLLIAAHALAQPLTERKYWDIRLNVCADSIYDCNVYLSSHRRAPSIRVKLSRLIGKFRRDCRPNEQVSWPPNRLLIMLLAGHTERARTLNELRRPQEAEQEYTLAFEAIAQMEVTTDLLTAKANLYQQRAQFRVKNGQLRDALADFDAAVAILEPISVAAKDPALSKELSDCLKARGNTREDLGDSWGMRADYKRVVEMQSDTVAESLENHLVRAKALLNRASAEFHDSRFEPAVADFTQAIELLRSPNLDLDARELVRGLIGRGTSLNSLARFEEALVDLDEAIAIARNLPDSEAQATAHHDRALVFRGLQRNMAALNELAEAARLYRSTMSGLGEPAPQILESVAACLADTALLWIQEGRRDNALTTITQAIDIWQSMLTESEDLGLWRRLGYALNVRGSIYSLMERYEDAETDLSSAIELYRGLVNYAGRPDEKELASAYQNRASVRNNLSKNSEALDDVKRANAIHKRLVENHKSAHLPGQANVLSIAGTINTCEGNWTAAADAYTASAELWDRVIDAAVTEQERKGCVDDMALVVGQLVACLCHLARTDPSAAKQAAYWSERGRARELAAVLAMGTRRPKGYGAAEYQNYLDEENALRDVDRLLDAAESEAFALSHNALRRQGLEKRIEELRRRRLQFFQNLKRTRERFRTLDPKWDPTAETISIEEIQAVARTSGATLLTLQLTRLGTAVVAVTPEGRIYAELFEAVTIDLVLAWLTSKPQQNTRSQGWLTAYAKFADIPAHDARYQQREAGWHAALWETMGLAGKHLWCPLVNWLRNKSQQDASVSQLDRIVLMAGSFLSNFPHQAAWWWDGSKHHFLIDELSLSYVPSVRILRECLTRRERVTAAVPTLFATRNPTAHCPGDELVWTEYEADRAATSFADVIILGHSKDTRNHPATSERVMNELPRHSVALLATHGVFDWKNPWTGSGILTADHRPGSGRQPDLQLGDVYDLDLSSVELVALTACESARSVIGDVAGNQLGLPSALLLAGATCVIGSHWLIDDLASALLTERFFQETFPEPGTRRLPVSDGLRRAQSWLRELTHQKALDILEKIEQELPEAVARPKPGTAILLTREHIRAARAQINQRGETPFRHPVYWAAFACYGAP